ncbi:MAG: copper amine oxidase N-terminal domain-containing protein [Bacillota bacterium]|nr:copper amine oxidase N-terminal domain-containing protein [Bacillota bacterium]
MGRLPKIFIALLLSLGLLLSPFLKQPAAASSPADPLVSRSWVEQRLDSVFQSLEQRISTLEQKIRALSGQGEVDITLYIGKTQAQVNGESKTLDAAPRIAGSGYTLVPIRFVAEALRIQVEWIPETKQIRFYDADTEMLLTVGSTAASIDGRPYTMDHPPVIDSAHSQGRTLVHVRFVGEAFGCRLDWEPRDGATEIVRITR